MAEGPSSRPHGSLEAMTVTRPTREQSGTTAADRRSSSARLAVALAVFMGLAVSGAVLLRALAPGPTPRLAATEVILYLAVLLSLFWLSPQLRRTAAALPRAYTGPLVVMFLLMFVGQLFGSSSVTFPFAAWTM